MKKSLLCFLFLFLFILTGCSKSEPSAQPQTPAPEEADAQLPVATAAGSDSPAGACDNIFYPLALNNQWVYRFDMYEMDYSESTLDAVASETAMTVSAVSADSAELALLDYNSGLVTQSTVRCQDQAILDFPMTELKMVFVDLAGSLEIEYVSGLFMPSEQQLIDSDWNMSWETQYAASGTLNGSYEGESLSASLSHSPIKMKWQVLSTGETLEVKAGTFSDLVKVNREISFEIPSLKATFQGNPLDISTKLTLNTDLWYAPHIGLVKQAVNSAQVKVLGIDFPISAWGYIELVSYQVGQ